MCHSSVKWIFIRILLFSKIVFHRLNIWFLFNCFIKMIKVFCSFFLFCCRNSADWKLFFNMNWTHPALRFLKSINNGHYFWDSFLSFFFLFFKLFLFCFFFLVFFCRLSNKRTKSSLSIHIFYLIYCLFLFIL